jgi:hypothetical protein
VVKIIIKKIKGALLAIKRLVLSIGKLRFPFRFLSPRRSIGRW